MRSRGLFTARGKGAGTRVLFLFPSLFCALFWGALFPGLPGAASAAMPAKSSDVDRCPPRGLSIDRPLLLKEGCAAWRYIGVRDENQKICPAPADISGVRWQVRPLFQPLPGQSVPAVLQPYCLYVAKGASGRHFSRIRKALQRLIGRGELLSATSSCAALRPSAQAGEKVHPNLAAWRRWQSNFFDHAEARLPFFKPEQKIRLSILDTQPASPTGFFASPTSKHGHSLAHLAKSLVCQDERCAADVMPRLALPISTFDWRDESKTVPDPVNGGFFGTIDQLAESVWEEVRDSDDRKLVINLSIAWVGEHFGGLEESREQMPDPVRGLFDALRIASCKGALVVAAAGNRLGGPQREFGPLLPAGWERRPAPDRRTCRAITNPDLGVGEKAGTEVDRPRVRPLVYAVAGIGLDGSSLSNARPGSASARAAFGDHVVIDATEHTMTGSSVSALVASAAAAVAWSHRTDLDAHGLMDLVEEAGRPLGRRADFQTAGLQGAPKEVRRIGVCTALARALDPDCRGNAQGGGCDYRCESPPAKLPRYRKVDCSDNKPIRLDALTGMMPLDPFCGITSVRFDTEVGRPKDPCPYRQYFGLQTRPWAGAQPHDPPCSGCDIQMPPDYGGQGDMASSLGVAELRIEIDPSWNGGPVGPAILAIGDAGYALDLRLEKGECALVQNIDVDLLEGAHGGARPPVRLHFMTAAGVSVENPIFLGSEEE